MPFVQGTTPCAFCHYAILRLENVFKCPVCEDEYFHSDCVDESSQKCPTCDTTAGDSDRLLQTTALSGDQGIAWSVTSYESEDDDEGADEGGYEADDEGDGGRGARAPAQAPAPRKTEQKDYGEDLDQASGALRGHLIDFLRAAPDPTEWVYEGWSPSGPVLSWTGDGDDLGLQGTVTVRFHVHVERTTKGVRWNFGSVWIGNVKKSGLGIGRVLTSSGDDARLVAVVKHFLARIRKDL